jgi:hypothetical protein
VSDEQLEILARELYVRRWAANGGPHTYATARTCRESWYRRLNEERREKWRLTAKLLVESLLESGLRVEGTNHDR